MDSHLEAMSLDRIRDAFNPATALFDRQIRDGRWGPTRGTEGLTSTAIAIVGLSRAAVPSDRVGMDLSATCAALIDLAGKLGYWEGLGLVVWANAVTEGPPAADVLRRAGLVLDDLPAIARRFQTMEVAWWLSGLAHELARAPDLEIRGAFVAIREALIARFVVPSKTFRHATYDASPLRRARRWVANFADQIYPIQALAFAELVDRDGRTLEVASAAAEHLTASQGPLGQWWWHYEARSGRVVQAYPVYSVHQHGMAPMAFRALAAAGGPDFAGAVDRGMSWLVANELGVPLVDPEAGTIWRDLERDEGAVARTVRRARAVIGRGGDRPSATPRLRINRETRPYEWAWLLYAASIGRGSTTNHLT